MALVSPVIFQVVGYQNSGKTTLIVKLIQRLREQGVKTAVIKHHGHGGKPEVLGEKDSRKHLEAGAIVSSVEGGGRLILQTDDYSDSLEKQIELMNLFYPELILIEGHKKQEYPKLLLLRNQEDLVLLEGIRNVAVVGYWQEQLKPYIDHLNIPSFFVKDETAINGIAQMLKNLVKKEG